MAHATGLPTMNNSSDLQVHLSGWVQGPRTRGTEDILWSCILAVFVCTWTVLHLNVPASSDGRLTILLRKARWMALAIIVPEVVTCSAFVQRVAARNAMVSMNALAGEWDLCHAFYLNMGGVWLQPRDSKAFPINAAHLEYLVKKRIMPCPRLDSKAIWDRSKADSFAKVFACLQIFWLAVQCAGRGIQNIPVTPLEIATLGFMIPSLATFAMWFSKPVDVGVPTTIDLDICTEELLEKISPAVYSWRDTPLDFIQKINAPSVTSEILKIFPKSPTRPAERIGNDVFALKYTILDQLVVASTWVGYAGTHFSAWNFSFPTDTEVLLWRISCVIMASSMFLFWLTSNRKFYILFTYCAFSKRQKEKLRQVAYERQRVSTIQVIVGIFSALAYLCARFAIIVMSFTSLRSLPKGVFLTVQWTNFLPHIG